MGKNINRWALILVALGVAYNAAGQTTDLGRIRLRRQAIVQSQSVLLSDVAVLTGPEALRLSSIEVGTIPAGSTSIKVRLVGLRPILHQHVANWGRLSLGGFGHCRVQFVPEVLGAKSTDSTEGVEGSANAAADPNGLILANPTEPISVDSVMTLRDHTLNFLQQITGWGEGQMDVSFADRDMAVLASMVRQDRIEFEPGGDVGVGRLPITIHRYQKGRLISSERITADIALRLLGVVAKRTITRGQLVAPGDVQIREVLIDRSGIEPLTDLDEVIGLSAARFIRKGTVLEAEDLRAPVMVRRGELVTVLCMTNGLMIKTVARAAEAGSLGQLIRVRNDQSRERYTVRVTGPRRASTLENSEGTG